MNSQANQFMQQYWNAKYCIEKLQKENEELKAEIEELNEMLKDYVKKLGGG